MDTLSILERNILGALPDGDVKELAVLRAQADTVSVVHREMTGVGFFTTLSVSPDSERLALGGRAIHDVSAEIVEDDLHVLRIAADQALGFGVIGSSRSASRVIAATPMLVGLPGGSP